MQSGLRFCWRRGLEMTHQRHRACKFAVVHKAAFQCDRVRPSGRREHMQRRQFITLLGGTAAVWPFVAHAQRPENMRRIGVLMGLAGNDAGSGARVRAFRQELARLGWTEGRNVLTDYRWSGGESDR